MRSSDILIIGGGIAGLSLGSTLSEYMRVTVLEAEAMLGVHASGRSASMLHFALGNPIVRSLTAASYGFFAAPPAEFASVPLASETPVVIHAREDELAALEALALEVGRFARIRELGPGELSMECPLLRVGAGGAVKGFVDDRALKIDSNALLHAHARRLRANGGRLVTEAAAIGISRKAPGWIVDTYSHGRFCAPVVVNAAGAWADAVAKRAGVSSPGLRPLRRTVIAFEPQDKLRSIACPFTRTVGEELVFGMDAGSYFGSALNEDPNVPCDVRPEELDIAVAAHRLEERTWMSVRRITHSWAGLRTFAADRVPVIGFGDDDPSFFWLCGQGGAGIQTSPALSAAAAALIMGEKWPLEDIQPDALGPARHQQNGNPVVPGTRAIFPKQAADPRR